MVINFNNNVMLHNNKDGMVISNKGNNESMLMKLRQ